MKAMKRILSFFLCGILLAGGLPAQAAETAPQAVETDKLTTDETTAALPDASETATETEADALTTESVEAGSDALLVSEPVSDSAESQETSASPDSFSASHSAAGAGAVQTLDVTSSNLDQFKKLLQAGGNVNFTLKQDILLDQPDVTQSPTEEYWEHVYTVGSGKKTFDLNGYTFETNFHWKDGRGLFRIPSGASLTIEDTSGNRSGRFFCYGALAGDRMDYRQRRVFTLDGGSLVVNGGECEAGRSKEMFESERLKSTFLGISHNYALGYTYSGNIWQQDCGSALTINSGSAVINGGTLAGRGYRITDYQSFTKPCGWYRAWEEGTIKALGGSLTINGGEIIARGYANPLISSPGATVEINGGYFQRSTLDRVEYEIYYMVDGKPTNNSDDDKLIYDDAHSYGLRGINESKTLLYINDKLVSWEDAKNKDKELFHNTYNDYAGSVRIEPRKDLSLTVMDLSAPYLEVREAEDTVYWDGSSELILRGIYPKYYAPYPYTVRRGFTFVQSMNKLGVSPAVIIGGETYYDGGGGNLSEITHSYNTWTEDLTKKDAEGNFFFEINAADYAPAKLAVGEGFQLSLQAAEILPRTEADKVGSDYIGYVRTVYVKKVDDTPEVVTQPKSVIAEHKGDKVTLTAVVDHAEHACWQMVSPSSMNLDNWQTFTNNTTCSVTVTADSNRSYRCIFRNDSIVTASDVVTVSYKPAFDNAGASTATAYNGWAEVTLSARADISNIPNTTVEWLKGGSRLSGSRYSVSRTNLTIKKPTTADSGDYVCRVGVKDLQTGDTTHADYTISLTVLPAEENQQIKSLAFLGKGGEFYIGDAFSGEGLKYNDPRVKSAEFSWTGGAYNNVIESPNPSFEIKLEAKDNYVFALDEGGYFPWVFDGLSTKSWKGDAGAQFNTLTLSYTFDNNHALKSAPEDEVNLDVQSFGELIPGTAFDEDIQLYMVCPEDHKTEHSITGVGIYDKRPLPSFLKYSVRKVSQNYAKLRIYGEIPEDAQTGEYTAAIEVETNGNPTLLYAVVSFYVPVNRTKFITALPSLHTEHSWSAWSSDGTMTHSRSCSCCKAKEQEAHAWKETGVIKPATESSSGILQYTCALCGATKQESYASDGEDETPKPTYSVSISPNGGSGDYQQSILGKGAVLTLPSAEDIGYTAPSTMAFYGWTIGGKEYFAEDTYEITGATQILANWKYETELDARPAHIQLSGTTSLSVGEKGLLTATVQNMSYYSSPSQSVRFSSSDDTCLLVSSDGTIRALSYPGDGKKITVTAVSAVLSTVSASIDITITRPKATGITLSSTSLTLTESAGSYTASMTAGQSTVLEAFVSPTGASQAITWTSADENVLTVSSSGVLAAKSITVSEKTCVITAKANDGSNKSVSLTVMVKQGDAAQPATVPVSTIQITPSDSASLTLYVEETSVFSGAAKGVWKGLQLAPTNGSIGWESSNEEILKVCATENGTFTKSISASQTVYVKALKNGKVNLVALAEDGSKKKQSISLTVRTKVSAITLDKTGLSLDIGARYTLKAAFSPETASDKTLNWESSDSAVASVSDNGQVTAVGLGSCVITAVSKEGGKKASCSVDVDAAITGVILEPASLTLRSPLTNDTGDNLSGLISGKAICASTGTAAKPLLSWSISDSSVATICGTQNGSYSGSVSNATAVYVKAGSKAGTAKLTAVSENGKKATVSVTVKGSVSDILISSGKNLHTLAVGKTLSLTAKPVLSPEKSSAYNNGITWVSSDEGVATVSASGVVSAVAKGTASITAKARDGSGKTTSSAYQITVNNPVSKFKLQTITLPAGAGTFDMNKAIIVTPSGADYTVVSGSWALAKTDIGTINQTTGVFTPTKAGNTQFSVQVKSDALGTVNLRAKVTVLASGATQATAIKLSSAGPTLTAGGAYEGTAELTPAVPGTVMTISLTGGSYATVTAGTKTATTGTPTIKVTVPDSGVLSYTISGSAAGKAVVQFATGAGKTLKTAKCTAQVRPAVSALTITCAGKKNPSEVTLGKGRSASVSAKLTGGLNKGVSYSIVKTYDKSGTQLSSDLALYSVITLTEGGRINALSEGRAVIRVTSKEDPSVYGDLSISVVSQLSSIKLSASKLTVAENTQGKLCVSAFLPADASTQTVSWVVVNAQKTGTDQKGKDKTLMRLGNQNQTSGNSYVQSTDSDTPYTTQGNTPVGFMASPGIYTLEARVSNGKGGLARARCTVYVLGSVQSFTFPAKTNAGLEDLTDKDVPYDYAATLSPGKTLTLKPLVTITGYGAPTQIAYRSSDQKLAVVKNGRISVPKGVPKGSVVYITAASRDGEHGRYVRVVVQ